MPSDGRTCLSGPANGLLFRHGCATVPSQARQDVSSCGQDLLLGQAALQREVTRSIPVAGRDCCGIGALNLGPMCGAATLIARPSPRAARMQPVMPLYARDEKAPSAVWAADVPLARHCSARLTEPGPSFSKPPTAVHAVRAGQATAGIEMSWAAGSSGVGWIRQLVPFHRRARSIPPELVNVNPTAVQAAGAGQATPVSWPPPAAVGVGWMRQLVPFHRSARVPRSEPPTARQADGPVQSTPGRLANWTPGGLGVGWMRQLVPFHRSATVCTIPAAECCSPVVVQADGAVQDTAPRKVCTAPAGLGLGTMAHFCPFHRSVNDLTGPSGEGLVE